MERGIETASNRVPSGGLPAPAEHCHASCELAGFSQGRPEIPVHTARPGVPLSPPEAWLELQCMLPAIAFSPRKVEALPAWLDNVTMQ